MWVGVHVAQALDTFIDACVSILLGLVLELNHVRLYILLDVHVPLLLRIKEITDQTIKANALTMDSRER